MAPLPSQYQALKRQAFSFHPAILNVEHNQWKVRRTTATEIVVTNVKSDLEIWIPRRLVVEIVEDGGFGTTVTLSGELEYKAGTAHVRESRLTEMPSVGQSEPGEVSSKPRRAGSKTWLAALIVGGVLALAALAALFLSR